MMSRTFQQKFSFAVFLFLSMAVFSQSMLKTEYGTKDSIVYYYQHKKYDTSKKLASAYLENNPYDLEIVYLNGQINYHLKQWSSAIELFKRSIENGYHIAEAKYYASRCYALKDNKAEAVRWLQSALNDFPSFYYQWMEDPDFKTLAADPEYLDQLYKYDRTAKNRVSKWKADLEFYNDRMKQFHYNLFRNIREEAWDAKVDELRNRIAELNDEEIIVKIMELSALAGDGHTVVIPPTSDDFNFMTSPLLTYVFEDGVYILETHKDYEQLLGSKLMAINGMPIDEVLNRIQCIVPADNEFGNKWLQPLVLYIPQLLFGLNIIDNNAEYTISYTKDEKKGEAKIKCKDMLTADFLESWLYGFHEIDGWLKVKTLQVPSSRKNTEKPYWFEYLKDKDVVVFHYNQVQTDEKENEQQFIKRLNDFIEDNAVKALIIDLRYNEGGDNTMYRPILNGLISNNRMNRKGRLFALIGRRTFSAGMCFATELERSTNITFVGEPSGSSPNFVGESGGVFQLPYSGIYANASNLFWQNSFAFDNRKFISPEWYVKSTFEDYIKGIDRPIEVALNAIDAHWE